MADLAQGEKVRRAVAELSSRAETALSTWSEQRRNRTALPANATTREAERIIAEDKLRQQLAELDSETIAVQREYEAKAATTAGWEERAMTAMQHSDDVTAREAHEAHAEHLEDLQELEGELFILRALARACREALAV